MGVPPRRRRGSAQRERGFVSPPYTLHPTPCTHTLNLHPHPTPYTLHPALYTLHTAHQILNTKPYTPNPTHQTLHPSPHTLHCRGVGIWGVGGTAPSASRKCTTRGFGSPPPPSSEGHMVSGIWCLVSDIWHMVFGIWYMVYGIWYMVYGIWYMLYAFGILCTLGGLGVTAPSASRK